MIISGATKKTVRGKMIIIAFVFSILIGSCSSECTSNILELAKCKKPLESLENKLSKSPIETVSEMIQSGPFSSPFATVSDMFKECQVQSNIISCVKRLVESCLTVGRQFFEATTSGTQNLATELCNNASETHRKYMDSFDCIQNAVREATQCTEKFALSLKLIQEEIEDNLSKSFYTCCAFDWMKSCKVRIANELCGPDTGSLVNRMAEMEVGNILSQVCGSDIGDCYGRLYGVDHGGHLESSLTTCIFLIAVLWVTQLYRN